MFVLVIKPVRVFFVASICQVIAANAPASITKVAIAAALFTMGFLV